MINPPCPLFCHPERSESASAIEGPSVPEAVQCYPQARWIGGWQAFAAVRPVAGCGRRVSTRPQGPFDSRSFGLAPAQDDRRKRNDGLIRIHRLPSFPNSVWECSSSGELRSRSGLAEEGTEFPGRQTFPNRSLGTRAGATGTSSLGDTLKKESSLTGPVRRSPRTSNRSALRSGCPLIYFPRSCSHELCVALASVGPTFANTLKICYFRVPTSHK